jgi:hypothetical protein
VLLHRQNAHEALVSNASVALDQLHSFHELLSCQHKDSADQGVVKSAAGVASTPPGGLMYTS